MGYAVKLQKKSGEKWEPLCEKLDYYLGSSTYSKTFTANDGFIIIASSGSRGGVSVSSSTSDSYYYSFIEGTAKFIVYNAKTCGTVTVRTGSIGSDVMVMHSNAKTYTKYFTQVAGGTYISFTAPANMDHSARYLAFVTSNRATIGKWDGCCRLLYNNPNTEIANQSSIFVETQYFENLMFGGISVYDTPRVFIGVFMIE